jgi:hypothetical protein
MKNRAILVFWLLFVMLSGGIQGYFIGRRAERNLVRKESGSVINLKTDEESPLFIVPEPKENVTLDTRIKWRVYTNMECRCWIQKGSAIYSPKVPCPAN